MRSLLRIFALISLAVGVIGFVVDIARSLAATRIVLTPLSESWETFAPSILAIVQIFLLEKLPRVFYDPVFIYFLKTPASAVFVILAMILYVLGAKREKRFGQIGNP